MAKVEGCWANVLDDCDGDLTEEHLISVAVWEPVAGGRDNREGKLAKEVTFSGMGNNEAQTVPLEQLTAKVLCRHHNNSTQDLDNAAGDLRRKLLDYVRTIELRKHMRHRWPPQRATVDGPRLERWFIKTAITNARRFGLPIGSPDEPTGQPTVELAEIVFGKRKVQRPMGLSHVQWQHHTMDFKEEFNFVYWDRNSTHIAGCLLRFRDMLFAVKLEAVDVPEETFQEVLGQPHAADLQPFRGMNSPVNVTLYINWPDEPLRRKPRSKRR